jgi:hypothetical protein
LRSGDDASQLLGETNQHIVFIPLLGAFGFVGWRRNKISLLHGRILEQMILQNMLDVIFLVD